MAREIGDGYGKDRNHRLEPEHEPGQAGLGEQGPQPQGAPPARVVVAAGWAGRWISQPWDPPGAGFRSLFDNFFSSQRPLFSLSEKVWNPPTDVYETAGSVVVKMEIAGVSWEELDVRVEDGFLVIRGRRRESPCVDTENFHLMEIRYGAFERAFPLPSDTRHDEIQAQYSNGFLIVTVPKREAITREIPVQVAED